MSRGISSKCHFSFSPAAALQLGYLRSLAPPSLPPSLSYMCMYFKNRLYFLGSQQNWDSAESSHTPLPPHTRRPPPLPTPPRGQCVCSRHRSYPDASPSPKAHSSQKASLVVLWCCAFCGCGRMCDDRCLPSQSHAGQAHCPGSPLCSLPSHLTRGSPWSSLLHP